MILFDNIYYLLYNYFQRTNSGTFGYKLTSISLTSLYIYTFVCLLYSLINILYYLFFIDTSNTIIVQNSLFSFVNKDFIMLGSIICFIYSNIRYFTFKNINKIHEKINDRNMSRRERLNVLTVSYMVTSPFLLFFMADYLRDLYR
jgi:hypothetical protein